jgi:RNA polymerase sigma-70 factor (ECF subfamily)
MLLERSTDSAIVSSGSGISLLPWGATVGREASRELSQLFQRHGPMVVRRAQRLLGNAADAEEAAQEIFIRAFRGAEAFEARSQPTTWLYRITTNYCLNLLRDRARRAQLREEHLPQPGSEEEAGPARSDDVALLRRLLAEADPREAQAAVYVFVDGASHEEAAELLGVSKRTVGNLIERFRAAAHRLTEEPAEATPERSQGRQP